MGPVYVIYIGIGTATMSINQPRGVLQNYGDNEENGAYLRQRIQP